MSSSPATPCTSGCTAFDLSPPGQTGYSYPLGSFLWPIGYVYPEQQLTPRERGEGEGEAWTAIRKGTVVRDRSGDEIGVVDDLQFDTNSGRVEGMVIRAGGSIQTFFGGRQTMEIASSQVERVDEGEVYLRADKNQI
jgi:sporulation protein YlmC with PRC-barrel domain